MNRLMTIQEMPISNIINSSCPNYCPSQQEENLSKTDTETVFTFTGKERDAETGYGYFGARYMDHELTAMWLSVDPLADKYPGISPYAYCAWNPVKLVDPDGMDFEKIINHKDRTITISAQFANYSDNQLTQDKIQQAVDSWNASSFSVSMKNDEGEYVDYTVLFNINNGEGPTNFISVIPDDYFDKHHDGYSGSGGVSSGDKVSIKASQVSNAQIIAHEMGHCLGIGDDCNTPEGLMYSTNTGNFPCKKLSANSQISLMVSCGFNFGKLHSNNKQSLCTGTSVIGEAPSWFGQRLSERRLSNNNTKNFRK